MLFAYLSNFAYILAIPVSIATVQVIIYVTVPAARFLPVVFTAE